MREMWWRCAMVVGLMGCVACDDVSVGSCTLRDLTGCFDDGPWWDYDGGADASTNGAGDAGTTGADAGLDAGDIDAGQVDAEVDAGSIAGLSIGQFCDAQFATARRLLDGQCNCIGADEPGRLLAFLQDTLLYRDGATCSDAFTAIAAKTSYQPQLAAACAARFDAQFAVPTSATSCAPGGIDIGALEATVGKGVQFHAQLPECRAAFVGRTGRDGTCTNSLECSAGLRCLPLPGTPLDAPSNVPRSCQTARAVNNTCGTNSDCADGLVCAGASMRTCIPTTELKLTNSSCLASLECSAGDVCVNQACEPPTADVICMQ